MRAPWHASSLYIIAVGPMAHFPNRRPKPRKLREKQVSSEVKDAKSQAPSLAGIVDAAKIVIGMWYIQQSLSVAREAKLRFGR
jgi:hypothetical protein